MDDDPRREVQVSEQFGVAMDRTEVLKDLVERLNDRLSDVIVEEEKNITKEDAPDNPLVPLADRIRQLRRRIESANSRLQSIINRLEI